jgi:hypothetical protein
MTQEVSMHVLVTVRFPLDAGNELISNPGFSKDLQEILASHQATSVYFTPSSGQRGLFYVTDVPDGSHIPAITEPWWLRTHADVTMTPVFTPDEMAKAAPGIAAAVSKYRV